MTAAVLAPVIERPRRVAVPLARPAGLRSPGTGQKHLVVRFDAWGKIHWMNAAARELLGNARSIAGALACGAAVSTSASLPFADHWLWVARGAGPSLEERVDRINGLLLDVCRRRGRHNLDLARAGGHFEARWRWLAYQNALLQAGRDFIRAIETERGRIARELHDNAGQSLAGIHLNLELMERHLSSANQEALARLARSRELVSLTLEQIRRISHEMHPPQWDEQDFASAVEWVVESMGLRGKLAVDLDLSQAPADLAPEIKTTLYRAVQEGLTNVLRHSGAHRVKIQMTSRAGGVRLILEDDGCGFDPKAARPIQSAIGLSSIRQRLATLGGRLEISSAPGCGVRLSAFVPLAAPRSGISGQTSATMAPREI